MPLIILSIVLMVSIAAGIVWPMLKRQRVLPAEMVTAPQPAARTIEQLCPHCSIMNAPNRTVCYECGSALPLDNLSGLLGGADKQETIRELTQAGLFLAGMVVVMMVSNWLPVSGKIAVMIGTLGLLSFRFYKHVSGD